MQYVMALKMQAQERQKCPQPWIPFKQRTAHWGGVTLPPQSECRVRCMSPLQCPVQTLEQNLAKVLRLRHWNTVQRVRTGFRGTGQLSYTDEVLVYKTRPLQRTWEKNPFLESFWIIPLWVLLLVWHNVELHGSLLFLPLSFSPRKSIRQCCLCGWLKAWHQLWITEPG